MSVKTVQAVINGQTYNLTLNSSTGKYEATITAPGKSSYTLSGHYYPVTVKSTVSLRSHLRAQMMIPVSIRQPLGLRSIPVRKLPEIPSQRKQYQVVTNVHTHQTRHCLTEAIRSRLMHLIMTAMQQSRNPLHSRSIQYRRHCPLLHRLMVLLQIRRHAQSKVLPTMLLPVRLQ